MAGISAVIPAAGRGERLGHSTPKAFVPLEGIPLLAWTLAALEACPTVTEIIVVAPPGEQNRVWKIAVEHRFTRLTQVVEGAADRQNSVLNGMAAASPMADVILVHDAARPLTPLEVFERCGAAAADHGSASAALQVTDTLREGQIDGPCGPVVDRSRLVRIQTPQAIRGEIFRRSLATCRTIAAGCTDDSSMFEQAAGIRARLVTGSELSLKVTGPGDIALAEALIRSGAGVRPGAAAPDPVLPTRAAESITGNAAGGETGPGFSIGLGYDVHSFDVGRPMMLLGVRIPDSPGLSGHSDADVALHAVCDAILGAIGERDIGAHFPNDDPAYKGADSAALLEEVVEIAARAGWQPSQLDVTVIAERPRLGPHVDAMRQRLAQIAELAPGRIAIKATTNEKMGFIGRGEGIACFALVVMNRRRSGIEMKD